MLPLVTFLQLQSIYSLRQKNKVLSWYYTHAILVVHCYSNSRGRISIFGIATAWLMLVTRKYAGFPKARKLTCLLGILRLHSIRNTLCKMVWTKGF